MERPLRNGRINAVALTTILAAEPAVAKRTWKELLDRAAAAATIVAQARAKENYRSAGRNRMISRRTLLKTAALTASQAVPLPYLAREGFAQTPAHVLKLTMADTRNHPLYQVLLRFADDVKKKTSGAVEVQVYGTGELGSQLNILTGLQTGIIDLCAHTSGFIDTLFPQFQVLDLPFLFPDVASAEKVLDGPVGKQLAGLMPSKGIYSLTYGH